MARLISVSATLEELTGRPLLLGDIESSDVHLSFFSVPAQTIGDAFDVHGAYWQLRRTVEKLQFGVGDPLPTRSPLEHTLGWAALHLYNNGQGLSGPELRGRESIDVAHETEILADVDQGSYVFVQSAAPSAIYASLYGEPLFAVQNSPVTFASAARFAAAASPGAVTALTDGSNVAVAGVGLGGIFITYVAVPALRGLGDGLEVALKEWALRLAPRSAARSNQDGE